MNVDNSINDNLRASRREMTETFGSSVYDTAILLYACTTCKRMINDPAVRTMAYLGYSDLPTLLETALGFAEEQATGTMPTCPHCGNSKTRLVHSEYYAYSAPAAKDIVIRNTPPKGGFSKWRSASFWWDPIDSFVPLQALDDNQNIDFSLSILVRQLDIAKMEERSEIDHLVGFAEQMYSDVPGHPLLLEAAFKLVEHKKRSLALRIAETYTELHPYRAKGHYCIGSILFLVVNGGLMPFEALDKAIYHLEKAIEIDPELEQAAIDLANCFRIQERPEDAQNVLQNLIEQNPACATAYFYLGSLALQQEKAEAALAFFEKGSTIDPQDADFPMEQACAFILLGEVSKAEAALERAKAIDEDHPKLERVMTELDKLRTL